MAENLENYKLNRLWEYRLHIENQYYSRLNFFLVFESVLLGVVGALYSRPNSSIFVLRVIVILGFRITVIWLLVQSRHKLIFDAVNEEVAERMPEYVVTWNRINKKLGWFHRGLHAIFLLTYVVPLLVVFVWLCILLFFVNT